MLLIKYDYLSEAKKILNTKLEHLIKDNFINKSINKKTCKEYYEEMIELVNKKCHRKLKSFNCDFTGSTKHEPLIINCNTKYDVYNDKIID